MSVGNVFLLLLHVPHKLGWALLQVSFLYILGVIITSFSSRDFQILSLLLSGTP
jgi:hypothetical protein